MPQGLNSCVYQLSYGKTGFIIVLLKVVESIDVIKWGLNVYVEAAYFIKDVVYFIFKKVAFVRSMWIFNPRNTY